MKNIEEIEDAMNASCDLFYYGKRVKEVSINDKHKIVGIILEGETTSHIVKPSDLEVDPQLASEDKTCPFCKNRTAMITRTNFKGRGKELECSCTHCFKTFNKYVKYKNYLYPN